MTKPVINVKDAPLRTIGHGDTFAAQVGRIGPVIGAKKLGCQLHVVPAGKKAFPRHAHHANEEMFYIISGEGEYRIGDDIYHVSAGDVISAPSGDASTAHQIRNTGTAELRYLGFSTRIDPEVVEYPDSGKFAVASMVPEDKGLPGARVSYIGRFSEMNAVDYWEGEK